MTMCLLVVTVEMKITFFINLLINCLPWWEGDGHRSVEANCMRTVSIKHSGHEPVLAADLIVTYAGG